MYRRTRAVHGVHSDSTCNIDAVPFRRFEISTRLSPPEVRASLQAITRKRVGLWEGLTRSLGAAPADPPFTGYVAPTSFKIHRDIRYGNAFLPIVRGRIIAAPSGEALVRVTMSLPVYGAVFMLVWLSGVTWIIAATIAELLFRGNVFALVPIGMLMAGIGMVALGFYPEAWKAERIIRQALERT